MIAIAGAALGKTALGVLKMAWKPLSLMAVGVIIAHTIYYGPKIENKNLKLALQKQQMVSLESIIKDQNEKIQNASDTSKKEFNEMLEDLKDDLSKRETASQEAIEKILNSVTPESCVEANAFLLEQIDNLQWKDE